MATWQDQSGLGHNATGCAVSANYTTPAFANGKPAMRFGGTTGCLTTSYAGAAGTIIVVYNGYPPSSGNYSAVISGAPQAGKTITAYDIYSETPPQNTTPSGNYSVRLFSYGTTSSTSAYSYFNEVQRVRHIWSVSGMTNDGTTLKTYEAASNLGTATIPGGATVYTATGQVIGAGDYSGTHGSYFTGMIAEVIVYQGKISDSDYAGVVLWLQQKYDIGPTGGYLMSASDKSAGAYTDEALYILQGDGANFPYFIPTNYIPTLLPAPSTGHGGAQTATASLAPIILHDQDGNLAKYNGRYWISNSSCAYLGGMTYPCTYVDILTSTDLTTWTLAGRIDCDAVLDGTSASRGCFNDGWFIDRQNSNQVYAFFNAGNNEAQQAGNATYMAAVTLNSNGTFTLSSITAMAGSALPFGNVGTPISGFYVEQIVYLSGTYYAFGTNEANNSEISWWTSTTSPITGYNGAHGTITGTATAYSEWPNWVQINGTGQMTWDYTALSTARMQGANTDGILGTSTGLTSYIPMTFQSANTLLPFLPQSATIVKLPAVVLP